MLLSQAAAAAEAQGEEAQPPPPPEHAQLCLYCMRCTRYRTEAEFFQCVAPRIRAPPPRPARATLH